MSTKKQTADRPDRPTDTATLKPFFKSEHFRCKMRFWPQKPSSKLHFSTKKCDSGLKNIQTFFRQNCIFPNFFDAKMRLWPQKPSIKLHFFDAKMRFWPQQPSSKLRKCIFEKVAVPRDAPRALRGAQWRVPLCRKTRHSIHVRLRQSIARCE